MFGVDHDQAEMLLTVGHMARVSGLTTKALRHYDRIGLAEDIADDEDRDLLLADLETIPGQPRYWWVAAPQKSATPWQH